MNHADENQIPEAARHWVDRCLFDNRSVFTDESLWTVKNLEAFRLHFIENYLEGTETFFEKFEQQLSGGDPELARFAAELIWVLYLFPEVQILPKTKREQITRVWEWSGESFPDNPKVPIAFDFGMGNPGIAFQTHRWREVTFLWRLVSDFKSLDLEDREALLADPWDFIRWLDEVEDALSRSMRNILPKLLFPDFFEPTAGYHHKRDIQAAFSDKLPDDAESPVGLSKWAKIDFDLHAIRQKLEEENPGVVINFYEDPWVQVWKPTVYETEDPEPAKVAEPTVVSTPRHWVISPGANAFLWEEFQEQNIAAVGWDFMGDLEKYDSPDAVRTRLAEEYGEDSSYKNDKRALWDFSHEISPGDRIYAKQGFSRVLGFGIVTEGYTYDSNREEFHHVVGVDWQDTREVELLEGTRVPMKTLTNIDTYRKCREFLESFYSGEEAAPPPSLPKYTKKDAMADLFMSEEQFEDILTQLARKRNIVLQGPPGVGKTYVARRIAYAMMGEKNRDRAQMIQFHQSYSYEDFIQGYRPDGKGGFELKDGIFHNLCEVAREDAGRPYFLVIDEINRGNLSKIFGELMMLIEHDKRGKDFAVKLTYASAEVPEFHVPPNLHLIGTMNTADRSLSMVDYALRRRFAFISLVPEFGSGNFGKLLEERGASLDLIGRIRNRLDALNETILADTRNLGKGYRIGHSFFCPDENTTPDDDWYREVVDFEVAPLLREYWMDQEEKAESEIDALLG